MQQKCWPKCGPILGLAKVVQEEISRMVIAEDGFKKIDLVTGIDVSYKGNMGYATAVTVSYPNGEVIEVVNLKAPPPFPYIPTYLSFREAPLARVLLRHVKERPDVIMLNGHGIAHPRKCGLATFVGVCEGISSIGVATKLLYGVEVVKEKKIYVMDPKNREVIAGVLSDGASKIYVSIGNKISLKSAIDLTISLGGKGKLPKPLLEAHKESRRFAQSLERS